MSNVSYEQIRLEQLYLDHDFGHIIEIETKHEESFKTEGIAAEFAKFWQGFEEFFVDRERFEAEAHSFLVIFFKSRAEFDGIIEFGVAIAEFDAADV